MFRSKQSRLLCLLFALILCFQSFGLSVSAASDNLIDSDLSNWEILDSNYCSVNSQFGFYRVYYSRITSSSSDLGIRTGLIYDLTSLTAGKSYTLRFFLPDVSDLASASNGQFNMSASSYYNPFINLGGTLVIGLRDDATGDLYEDYCFVIDGTNYQSYFGKINELTFEMPSAKNPSIAIYYIDVNSAGSNCFFYFDDFSLIDNDSSNEDSFFSKLFEWFQEKFDAIGESFANLGNKLTDLKDSFQAKIDELKQGLIDGIKSLFVPDEQAILAWKESLNTLLKDHLGIIYTCSELLTDTLNLAFDIIFDAPDTYKISIPEVSFEAAGTTVPVFSAQDIDFSFMEKPVFKALYSMYTVALYIFFGSLEVKYALRVYRKVMNN